MRVRSDHVLLLAWVSVSLLLVGCSASPTRSLATPTTATRATVAAATPGSADAWGDSPEALRVTSEADAARLCQRLIPDGPAFAKALGFQPGSGSVDVFSYPTAPRNDFVTVGCLVPITPNAGMKALGIHLAWQPVSQEARAPGLLWVQGACADATIPEGWYQPNARERAMTEMRAVLKRLCG